MVRTRKSWREATITSRLDPDHCRAEYPGGGSGMFRAADIRAYGPGMGGDARQAAPACQSNNATKVVAVEIGHQPGGDHRRALPQRAPGMTSAAKPHYHKHFNRLFGLAQPSGWDGEGNHEEQHPQLIKAAPYPKI